MIFSLRVGAGRAPTLLFPSVHQSLQRVRQGPLTETTHLMSSIASFALSAFIRPHPLHLHLRPTRWHMDQVLQSRLL